MRYAFFCSPFLFSLLYHEIPKQSLSTPPECLAPSLQHIVATSCISLVNQYPLFLFPLMSTLTALFCLLLSPVSLLPTISSSLFPVPSNTNYPSNQLHIILSPFPIASCNIQMHTYTKTDR